MIRTATTAPTGVRAIAPQLGGLYAIWLREVKRAVRDRGQLIGGVSRPLLWVLIMGIGLNPYFRGEIYGEVRFVVPYTYLQFIFPAVIVLNIMYTSVQSAVSTIWDREFGFLARSWSRPCPVPPSCWGRFSAERPSPCSTAASCSCSPASWMSR